MKAVASRLILIVTLMLVVSGCGQSPAPAIVQPSPTTTLAPIPPAVLTGQVAPTPLRTDEPVQPLPMSMPTLTANAEAELTQEAIPSATPTDTPIPYNLSDGEVLTVTNGVIGANDGHQRIIVITVGSTFRLKMAGWYYGGAEDMYSINAQEGQYVPPDCVIDREPNGNKLCTYSIIPFKALKQGQTKIFISQGIGCADDANNPCPTPLPEPAGWDFVVLVRLKVGAR